MVHLIGMPKPIPCEHNPKKRCDECTKKHFAARKRDARAADPEKSRAAVKKWRTANPEKRREMDRKTRAKDPEHARAVHKRWRDANVERLRPLRNEQNKHWKRANPAKVRAGDRRRQGMIFAAGLTPSGILTRQNSKCPICDCDLRLLPNNQVHVDHDHAITDRPNVRGILCAKHNKGLGLFDHNIEHLENAIAYLRSNLTTPESC